MSVIVAEESVAAAGARHASSRLLVIPRGRRRGRWRPLDPDAVTDALAALEADAVVAARPAAADPGAAALPVLAGVMGLRGVRLPCDAVAAATTLALAAHPGFAACARGMEVVAVLVADGGALPALRPSVLARWAARAWRPCGSCDAGGPGGRRCCRCGAPVPRGAA